MLANKRMPPVKLPALPPARLPLLLPASVDRRRRASPAPGAAGCVPYKARGGVSRRGKRTPHSRARNASRCPPAGRPRTHTSRSADDIGLRSLRRTTGVRPRRKVHAGAGSHPSALALSWLTFTRSLEVIRGHQRSSEVIRGHQSWFTFTRSWSRLCSCSGGGGSPRRRMLCTYVAGRRVLPSQEGRSPSRPSPSA